MKTIDDIYTKKKTDLQNDIINKLAEYIPIKITKNLLASSPEKQFVIDTYKNKVRMDAIIAQFEKVRRSAQSDVGNNIICNGMAVTVNAELTTQCTVYG